MRHTLTFHLLGVSRKLQKAIGYKSERIPLSFSQARALMVVDMHPEISQIEISQKMQLEPASIVTLIDELERLNLAKRQILENNRRKYKIELTDIGKNYVKDIKKHAHELENFILKHLKANEADSLLAGIDKLNQILDTWAQNKNTKREEVKNGLSRTKRTLETKNAFLQE